jgi:DNA-binding CsgD family transcriptional regulator
MREPEWSVDRLKSEIAVLGTRGLSREEYFAELAPRLRRVVDSDATCWHTLDPQTRLLTSDEPRELVEAGIYTADTVAAAGEVLVRSEYQSDDRNTFAELATRRVPVGILAQATRGKPERTARYRELLEPSGIPHELRAAFVRRGRVWGAVHVARRESSGAFSDRDAEVLAQLVPTIAEGIRGSLRFDAARRVAGSEAPGLVVLDDRGEVELVTPPALPMLAAISAPGTRPDEGELPSAVHALAAFVRDQGGAAEGANVVTVPGRDGLVTLHASKPDLAGDRIAIVIEAARGPRAATVRLEAAGATAREREVATLIARGLTNPEIAEALVLSPHTVSDHVKSLFEKLGVSSRQELVARVFLDEYLPEVIQGTPLTSHGRFEVS